MEERFNLLQIVDSEKEKPVPINREQEKVIEKLENVLDFLKRVHIKTEESLVNITKPLDVLLSSLKYLPLELSFNELPTEIKSNILSYTCNNGAFLAASVCQEWKDILENRLKSFKDINIGKHCSNVYFDYSENKHVNECENSACFMPEETLKASLALNMDIPLSICNLVRNVNSHIIAEALVDVSNLTIQNNCECAEEGYPPDCPDIMTGQQLSHFFDGLENTTKIKESLELTSVHLDHLDQDRLANCLLNKTKKLTLDEGGDDVGNILDGETLTRKLALNANYELEFLILCQFDYPVERSVSIDLAEGLCKVRRVKLNHPFRLDTITTNRLMQNILTQDVVITSLDIGDVCIYSWRQLVSARELENAFNKMEVLVLFGMFTNEQVRMAKSLPDVQIETFWGNPNLFKISKGSL